MMKRLARKTNRILLLNKTQLHEIYRNCPDHTRLICQLAVNTGLRLNEIRSLKFSDFDLKNGIVHVALENTKTKKHDRVIPLNYASKSCIRFLSQNKKPEDFLTDLSDQAFKIHCYRLSRKLNFRFSFHSLRHTFITAFYNASLDPYLTAYVAGHRSIFTTMIYVHSTSHSAKRAIENLDFDFTGTELKNALSIRKKTKVS